MPYICSSKLCDDVDGKVIPEGRARTCLKCENGKPMHESCCRKHSENRHQGKGRCTPLKEIDIPGAITLR